MLKLGSSVNKTQAVDDISKRKRNGIGASEESAQRVCGSSGPPDLNSYLQIEHSEDIGRYLVASKDLIPGTILLQEDPFIVGPNFGVGPICLRCGSLILEPMEYSSRCEACEWPVCSDQCKATNQTSLHSPHECHILSKSLAKPQQPNQKNLFNIITPLRVLMMRTFDPKKWAGIEEMESHNEKRKLNREQWKFYQEEVVNCLRDVCGFKEFAEDDIHTACGYLQVNSFSVERTNMRGLYPRVYLLAHCCIPNTSHVIDSNYKMILRSTVSIRKGEMVTLSYADTLQAKFGSQLHQLVQAEGSTFDFGKFNNPPKLGFDRKIRGTMLRRTSLKDAKYFDCQCERCKDPTELGTHFSSLMCLKCGKGFLEPRNPLESDSEWICSKKTCDFVEKGSNASILIQKILDEVDNKKDNNIEYWEQFIRKYERILHASHHIMITAQCSLSQMYGKVPNYMIDEMTLEQLQRKIQLCQNVLKIVDVFEPGLSRIRGVTLYELHAPLLIYAIKNFKQGSSNKELLKRRLKEVIKYLQEAARILTFEDPSSQEGKLLWAAERALKETHSWESQIKNI